MGCLTSHTAFLRASLARTSGAHHGGMTMIPMARVCGSQSNRHAAERAWGRGQQAAAGAGRAARSWEDSPGKGAADCPPCARPARRAINPAHVSMGPVGPCAISSRRHGLARAAARAAAPRAVTGAGGVQGSMWTLTHSMPQVRLQLHAALAVMTGRRAWYARLMSCGPYA